jgi:hypothetical protein
MELVEPASGAIWRTAATKQIDVSFNALSDAVDEHESSGLDHVLWGSGPFDWSMWRQEGEMLRMDARRYREKERARRPLSPATQLQRDNTTRGLGSLDRQISRRQTVP